MNQKYLKGVIEDTGDECIFTATPENIASFIRQYSEDGFVIVGTLNNWKFLTASYGKVDNCPDTKYLTEKLQPALARIAGKPVREIALETVPQESVRGKRCPVPDWNFLYWAGYSDQRFQKIKDKSCLLPFSDGRCSHMVEVVVQTYRKNNNLAVLLVPWRGMTPGEEIWLTANLDGRLQPDHAYLDTNHNTQEAMEWLVDNNIAFPTGDIRPNGFCIYPEFAFNPERLRELDPDGYERHLQRRAEPLKRKEQDTSR